MKNYIKTLMTGLFALTLMAGFAVNAHAQAETDAADVTVGATVLAPLDVKTVTNLEFGFVQTGVIPQANPEAANLADAFDNVVDGPTSRSIGQVTVETNEGADVNVSWVEDINLTNDSDEDIEDILFTPKVIFLADTVQDTDTANDGDDVTSGQDHNYSVGADGDSFFLGGTLSATAGTGEAIPPNAAGVYEGTITFTAAFN